MQHTEFIHYALMAIAISLEVVANIFIKYSDGFRKRLMGLLGIFCILVSFTALSQAAKGIDLSIAYALWGGSGILLTAVAGLVLFKQKLTPARLVRNCFNYAGHLNSQTGVIAVSSPKHPFSIRQSKEEYPCRLDVPAVLDQENEMNASQLFERGERGGRWGVWILADFRHHGAQYERHKAL
ncbi:multidrug transporter EmrE-like cation transporter [Serratia marcescens]|uniref:Spermidine export protein MdtI n=1 Tax=Serratia marcescens TaxID=615 RepID=A0AA46QES6_SERMA|nr:multidrug transporter EmrE-like cation transporter [Serratia marcescens]